MAMLMQHFKERLLVGILLAIVCSPNLGCGFLPESTFKLASDSRLPKWSQPPSGLARKEVSLTMSYYIYPSGRKAEFVMQDTTKHTLGRVQGVVACNEPFHLKNINGSDYPAYEAITVDGTTEIVEHKAMEPIFYITDDAVVWKQYLTNGCG